jgi:hypothetical protein
MDQRDGLGEAHSSRSRGQAGGYRQPLRADVEAGENEPNYRGGRNVGLHHRAEIAESLVKSQWSKIAKKLFEVSHKQIDLMKAEMTAPGREVAYIVKARERFGSCEPSPHCSVTAPTAASNGPD